MTRPLRIDIANGWYHTMSRGFERGVVFDDHRDYEHFLEVLEAMVALYGVKVHAYVLLANHYHLLLQTPHANLSRSMQWLNVSYGVWFNRRHNRVGPLFQGRFKSVPIEGEGSWALRASVYLHLNPVRIAELGLGKRERKAEGQGLRTPRPDLVKARLEALRGYRWSSYPAYAGYRSRPGWLTCEDLWRRARRREGTPKASYRWHVEAPLKAGVEAVESLGMQIKGALALGSTVFVDRLRRSVRGDAHEQPLVRAWRRRLPFEMVIKVVATEKGEPWERFRDRHGDWGRDVALWLGRRHCGLTQAELGAAAGGVAYPAVGQAVRRMDALCRTDRRLHRLRARLEKQLLDIAT